MSFTATTGIPAANNNPSDDQPIMQVNNDSFIDIWDVDHIGFNSSNGGTHLQNTYTEFSTPPNPVANTTCVAYPSPGVVNPSVSEYYFKNVLGNFPLSAIRAFGVFGTTATPGTVVPTHSFNLDAVTPVTFTAPNIYTINLKANTTSSDNAVIFINSSNSANTWTYSFTSNVLTIVGNSLASPGRLVSFIVIQI